ncbi:monooxygenase [Marinifilum sp. N1E240]|uniref:monooxygenase n=1 Tax=Marinifilum sp. N1E240 TaxID=2608082 RepID=UPI00128C91B3|nr:monooxygenase [Marinifilum sp. N1E240]MPQ45922.1 monooxygenase [Marinifilum sp. N1E240]
MAVIMYVDFPHAGPFGEEMSAMLGDLARSINEEPGFIWKYWTQDEKARTAGGVYSFDTRENAKKYLAMHSERLSKMGYTNIRGRVFEINETLSKINKSL